eukprot:358604_1
MAASHEAYELHPGWIKMQDQSGDYFINIHNQQMSRIKPVQVTASQRSELPPPPTRQRSMSIDLSSVPQQTMLYKKRSNSVGGHMAVFPHQEWQQHQREQSMQYHHISKALQNQQMQKLTSIFPPPSESDDSFSTMSTLNSDNEISPMLSPSRSE